MPAKWVAFLIAWTVLSQSHTLNKQECSDGADYL